MARYKHAIPGSSKRQSPHWNADIVDQMVADGRMTSRRQRRRAGRSARAAAGEPRGDGGAATTRTSQQGATPSTSRTPAFLEPIATPPFYGAELRPATVASTACGLRIDPDAGVRGADGTRIAGLFAAGECTGGVVGAQYVGSGNNYANCVVFGRVAGASAAAFASRVSRDVIS